MRTTLLLLAAAAVAGTAGCQPERRSAPADAERPVRLQREPSLALPTLAEAAPREYPGLHNVVAFHDGYLSGGVPEGEAGFDALAAMGVRTIISVDGAEPDVEAARARGIRYIHLPIGYDGFDEERRRQLARASRDAIADGPVYIHCHHGKHRSAGAAATVAVSLGWADPDAMVGRMRIAGTAPHYTGLYGCAQRAAPLAWDVIEAVPADFPEISRPTDFVQGMVDIDVAMEHLEEIEAAGWRTPPDHPDLVPAAEAGRLADLLRYLAEVERSRREPESFARGMIENAKLAADLELMLLTHQPPESLSLQLQRVADSCKQCHRGYRD